MPESAVEPAKVRIALVHGTWARGAAWTRPDSLAATALRSIGGVTADVFALQWSGKNGERERWKATRKLKKSLGECNADLKVVVGHSHGGNIGALALHGEGEEEQRSGKRALVSLNTPFLNPVRRSAQVVVFHAILLFIGLALVIDELIVRLFGPTIGLASGVLAGLTAFAVVLFVPLVIAVAYRLFRAKPTEAPWLDRLYKPNGTDHGTRVLCIATADDEALGWLQFIETLLNLPFLILHRFALPLVLVSMIIAHYTMEWEFSRYSLAVFVNSMTLAESGDTPSILDFIIVPPLPDHVGAEAISQVSSELWSSGLTGLVAILSAQSIGEYFLRFWTILAVLGVLGSYVLGALAFGTGLGFRSLLATFFMRMRVSPVPLEFRHVEFMEIDPASSGWLRHSNAYGDAAVIRGVTEWLTALVTVAQSSPDPHDQSAGRAGPNPR